MENEVLGDLLVEDTNTDGQDDFDHTFDLSDADLEESEDESEQTSADDESEDDQEIENPTNNAFAQMRTQNKEFQQKLGQVDALVKALGMKDVDDFLAKGNQARVKKEAANKGIPLEIAQELEEMRALKNSIIAERAENANKQKMNNFMSNLQNFVDTNNLSEDAVDKLSQDLEKDGFSVDALVEMPKAALNRVLSSYVGVNYQKNLERKNAIRKELPINQTSKIDTVSLNKDIDSIARALAGK